MANQSSSGNRNENQSPDDSARKTEVKPPANRQTPDKTGPARRGKKTDPNDLTVDFFKEVSLGKALGYIIVVSILAFLFLIWLIYFRQTADDVAPWVGQLPALNAMLNSVSTLLILLGFRAVRQRNFSRHMKYMMAAFVTSTFFLISYLIYHHFVGHTPFPGEGLIRPIYFFILITHIILSAFVVPLVLTSFYLAWSGRLGTHRKVSWWTFPIWLYVSITGVVIFFILNAYV